uniref:NADH-ubiquinone oxidoreductase chain 2 n=1 Tax=Dolichovespula kuami TaxID=2901320 RepID=A0A9E7BYG5_9HYME|nr:NADH dehydrogenase subunit 2 [Dolichovespula kuami]UGB89879.1 NADH dehydrogenase subunit 2 [Dolichovespula kuami]
MPNYKKIMNNLSSNFLFILLIMTMFSIMILSIFMTNFMHLWILMEMNTLMLISMMAIYTKNFKMTFNYFIIQSISSLMIIFLMMYKNNLFLSTEWMNFLLIINFAMKMGLFPFFYWQPLINKYLSWNMIFLMSTTQKFIPLMMIHYFINMESMSINFMLFSLSILSSMFSSIMCFNESNMKKILTFSSLNHLSWMVFIIMFDTSMFILYFFFYSISMLFPCLLLNKFNINSFTNLIKMQKLNFKKTNFFFSMSILITSALPPFMTFLIKINSMKIMIMNLSLFSSIMFIIMSMFTLIFYMNIIIKLSMMIFIKTKFYNSNFLNFKNNWFSSIIMSIMTMTFLFSIFYFIN